MADAQDLGSCGQPCGFDPHYPYHVGASLVLLAPVFYARAPPRRMHHRRTHPVGARMARPSPVPATTGARDISNLVPGGYIIRPYGVDGGWCGRRSAPDPGAGGPIKPRRKSGAGPGGHTGRPYERTEGGSVGADFISARAHRCVGCTLGERTHRRGAHGASGTGCELRRAGGRWTRSRRHVGMPPYARSDRRSALHTVAGGRAMRAPTPGAASEPRHTSKPSFGWPL